MRKTIKHVMNILEEKEENLSLYLIGQKQPDNHLKNMKWVIQKQIREWRDMKHK